MTHVPDLVPVRMLNEVVFCERLLFLEWAQGEFVHNYFTVDGKRVHKRVDTSKGSLTPSQDRPYQATSVWLSSEKLGITGKIDIVEGDHGYVDVVEYKRGEAPDLPEKAYLPERVQVCAQVLLLRENGHVVRSAYIYFAETKRRVEIEITDELISATMTAVKRAKEICTQTTPPPPLVDSPKCAGCSLVQICLPDEVNALKTGSLPRKLVVAREEADALYVQEQGARVGLSGECLVVKVKDQKDMSVRLVHTSVVNAYGAVQISTQALRELMSRSIPVNFFTTGGWYCGRAVGTDSESKNIDIRIAQFREFTNPTACLLLAQTIVGAKIQNSRTLLKRNNELPKASLASRQLKELALKAQYTSPIESLLGVEGIAARVYFENFPSMLKRDDFTFDFNGRNRRPPLDRVNALLSFAYSLLVKDATQAAVNAGFDPLYGFYHQPRFGRPSLALDLMEEFRPLVADSVVISVINGGQVKLDDFVHANGAVALNSMTRKKFIHAYEQRMSEMVTHPLFDYRLSYRQAMAIQARILSRVLLGEIERYQAFTTR